MAKLSEQLAALLIDVQTLEDENGRLNAALAKRDGELFAIKNRTYTDMNKPTCSPQQARDVQEAYTHFATVKDGVAHAVNSGRTVTLKIPSALKVVEFQPKGGTLEDDVRKFLGLPPYQKSGFKNDKKFMAKLDKAYGQDQVDAMIKQLRGA